MLYFQLTCHFLLFSQREKKRIKSKQNEKQTQGGHVKKQRLSEYVYAGHGLDKGKPVVMQECDN